MVRSGRPDGPDGQQSLGDLVAQAAKDMSSLIRYEITLAKKEFTLDARRIGIVAGIGVIGLFVLCLIVVLLCFAYAYGLVAAFGIPIWAAFLYVTLTCVLVVALAGVFAYWLIRRVTGMKMTRKTVMDDIGMLRKADASPNGSSAVVKNPEVSAGKGAKAEIPPARS
jgi:membrane protein implicated in regulation of membrane protease activity